MQHEYSAREGTFNVKKRERLTLEKLIAIRLCSRVGLWLQDSANQTKMAEEQCLVNTFEQCSGMFNQGPTQLFMFKMHRWHSEINDYGSSDKSPVISGLCKSFSTGRELLTFNWPDSARSVEKRMEPPFCRINTAKSGGHNKAKYLSVMWALHMKRLKPWWRHRNMSKTRLHRAPMWETLLPYFSIRVPFSFGWNCIFDITYFSVLKNVSLELNSNRIWTIKRYSKMCNNCK